MTQRFKLRHRPYWQHYGTWVPGMFTVMTEVLGMVYKHRRGQYRSVTNICLKSFCPSPENSGSQIVCQVIAPTCPCLSSNFVSVNVWSSAYIECLYTERWTLLYIHFVLAVTEHTAAWILAELQHYCQYLGCWWLIMDWLVAITSKNKPVL